MELNRFVIANLTDGWNGWSAVITVFTGWLTVNGNIVFIKATKKTWIHSFGIGMTKFARFHSHLTAEKCHFVNCEIRIRVHRWLKKFKIPAGLTFFSSSHSSLLSPGFGCNRGNVIEPRYIHLQCDRPCVLDYRNRFNFSPK